MMTGHWLMRPRQVAATWSRSEDALAWLQARYAEAPPLVRDDGKDACSLEWKAMCALDALPRGGDVTWGYWTQSRMLVSYSVVCCPNLFHQELPCPIGAAAPRPLPSTVTSLDSRRRGNVPSPLAPA
ncbi:hypothetical protein AB0F03_34135 [Streptomyces sp. NPDC028722]|uniref:hypothetical protein n=1 Tax=Streptomyces sp. NPDC028722 TaxID=3155016 RepID=UPI0033F22359